MKRVLLSWSSGKDSAWALHLLRRRQDIEVAALLTASNSSANRVAMHAVRRSLVEAQAERVALPLWSVDLPSPCSNVAYEDCMAAVWRRASAEQIHEVAFGDLFLQDIRSYREQQLQTTGLRPIFPVWQLPTAALATDMIQAGVKAKITCVDPSKLDPALAGQEFNTAFLDSLPPHADPCGENGEFHSFVYDAPFFSRPISVSMGETVVRDGFVFADVLLATAPARTASGSAWGLCSDCVNGKTVASDRGSGFLRCMLSDSNPVFPRYPRLPVLTCAGWSAAHLS